MCRHDSRLYNGHVNGLSGISAHARTRRRPSVASQGRQPQSPLKAFNTFPQRVTIKLDRDNPISVVVVVVVVVAAVPIIVVVVAVVLRVCRTQQPATTREYLVLSSVTG